jgi:hypothetical protein
MMIYVKQLTQNNTNLDYSLPQIPSKNFKSIFITRFQSIINYKLLLFLDAVNEAVSNPMFRIFCLIFDIQPTFQNFILGTSKVIGAFKINQHFINHFSNFFNQPKTIVNHFSNYFNQFTDIFQRSQRNQAFIQGNNQQSNRLINQHINQHINQTNNLTTMQERNSEVN